MTGNAIPSCGDRSWLRSRYPRDVDGRGSSRKQGPAMSTVWPRAFAGMTDGECGAVSALMAEAVTTSPRKRLPLAGR